MCNFFEPSVLSKINPIRRRVVLGAGGLLASSAPVLARAPENLWPQQAREVIGPRGRSVDLHHLHTGERLALVLFDNEEPQAQMLNGFRHFLRDHYSGDIGPMDPGLLQIMFRVMRAQDIAHGRFEVISGFRSKKTNEYLRRKGRRVARNSYHIRGQAIDIRPVGSKLKDLRDAATAEKTGGIGYYRRSAFVHLDTGRLRHW